MTLCQTKYVRKLSNEALLSKLGELIYKDNAIEAELLAFIGEVDHRRLYREQAKSSMFQYCVEELHLSESMAYKRIQVARKAREFPALLDKIAKGELNLAGVCLLIPHLTKENVTKLLGEAAFRSKRKIQQILAEYFPKPDIPVQIRKLPSLKINEKQNQNIEITNPVSITPSTRAESKPSFQHNKVAPLSKERFKIQFSAKSAFRAKLEKAQQLLGPAVKVRDLEAVFDRALDCLILDLENRKHGKTTRPHKVRKNILSKNQSRKIPRSVRREVYKRDEGQCAYVGRNGLRCTERSGLEYHHKKPFGRGGKSSLENLELRCKAHNQLAAECDYGAEVMSRYWHTGVREKTETYEKLQPGKPAPVPVRSSLVNGQSNLEDGCFVGPTLLCRIQRLGIYRRYEGV